MSRRGGVVLLVYFTLEPTPRFQPLDSDSERNEETEGPQSENGEGRKTGVTGTVLSDQRTVGRSDPLNVPSGNVGELGTLSGPFGDPSDLTTDTPRL